MCSFGHHAWKKNVIENLISQGKWNWVHTSSEVKFKEDIIITRGPLIWRTIGKLVPLICHVSFFVICLNIGSRMKITPLWIRMVSLIWGYVLFYLYRGVLVLISYAHANGSFLSKNLNNYTWKYFLWLKTICFPSIKQYLLQVVYFEALCI